jgi:hypothetical protein
LKAKPVSSGRSTRHSARTLLLFGLLAALAYPIADIVGGVAWRSYSYASQGVSELMALGAQSRVAAFA